MLSHIQVFCFLASYAVALALEVSRLWFRSRVPRAVMLTFVAAGWFAQTVFLFYPPAQGGGAPLAGYFHWLLLAAWTLMLVYFYLACFHPAQHLGIFFLPLALGLIVGANWFTDHNQRFAQEQTSRVWGMIHGMSILAGAVTVFFAFAAGAMYLWQARQLKRRRASPSARGYPALRLPSLEWLQTANARALVASMLLVGLAVASGIELSRLGGRGVSLQDPAIWGTLALFSWLLLHVIIAAVYRPIRQGRKVAYLTMVSFAFLLITLVLAIVINSKHGGAPREASRVEQATELHEPS